MAEKVASTAGILMIMMLVSQSYIYPIVMRTVEMKASGMPLVKRLEAFPWILSDLLFPFMMEYMVRPYQIPHFKYRTVTNKFTDDMGEFSHFF